MGSAGRDRALMRQQRAAINSDLTKSITRSIQLGEARAKKVEIAASAGIAAAKKSLNTLASEKIEKYANKVFAIVNGNRQKIADNYLSLKAYAAKGKGRNLSSIGDLLTSCAQLASVRPGKDEGVGAGAKTLPLLFSSKTVKVANPVTKINFLVDEYIKLLGQVQQRWPMGLGKYLLSKVESNMQSRGVLEVDRIEGKAGNFVFINARSVGLSSKLSDFQGLAARMAAYQSVLAKLTGKLARKHAKKAAKPVNAKPPEWQGN